MSEVQRQGVNALSAVFWRTQEIEKRRASIDWEQSRLSGFSPDKVDRLRNEMQKLERAREAFVLFLAQGNLNAKLLSWGPAPLEFLDRVSWAWPLPVPELLDRARKGQVSNPCLALAVAASVANTLSDDYPDGSETTAALVDFAEDVGEMLRSIKTCH
jgi:hypothetical protein